MNTITLTLPGNPITKKNSQRIVTNRSTGRAMIIPSAQYKAYEAACGNAVMFYFKGEPIAVPVNVQCVYYMQTARKVDLSNLLEATHDILVRYGVLADDNSGIVASVDGSRVAIDRQFPRVEIVITEVEG